MNAPYPFTLSLQQKRQAALLYHFSSIEFLDAIISRVRALAAFTDQTLDYAVRVERDKAMPAHGWAEGHLAANWFKYAHPMLNDCLRALLRQKRMRATEWYDIAGVRGTLTGMDHFLMNWSLPEEEEKIRELSSDAAGLGAQLDSTIYHTWRDLGMESSWNLYKSDMPKVPKFRIRTDVEGESGKRPIRTGVYVPQDDPNGTLQFAWTGNNGGTLGPCATFSGLALEYLAIVGRDKIWRAPNEATRKKERVEPTAKYFDDWCRAHKEMQFTDVISSRNKRAFVERSCKWYFVEKSPENSKTVPP